MACHIYPDMRHWLLRSVRQDLPRLSFLYAERLVKELSLLFVPNKLSYWCYRRENFSQFQLYFYGQVLLKYVLISVYLFVLQEALEESDDSDEEEL